MDIGASGAGNDRNLKVWGNIEATGYTRAANGNVTLPGIAFTSSTGTGIYRPNANQLAISTNAVLNTNFTETGVVIGTTTTNRSLTVKGTLKPDNLIQYGVSAVQTANFDINTMITHLIRVDPPLTDLTVTLSNVAVGAHYVLTKETTTGNMFLTTAAGINYNGTTRNGFTVIAIGVTGIWKIWQVSATDWWGEI